MQITLQTIIGAINLVGIFGILATMIGMRASVCNQIYLRWQALLFKTSDIDDAYNILSTTAYESGKRSKAHYIAVGYLNLFEEAYRYHESRLLLFIRLLPKPFWKSIQSSMKKHFRDWEYLRTFWHLERSSYSKDFNDFIEKEIIG